MSCSIAVVLTLPGIRTDPAVFVLELKKKFLLKSDMYITFDLYNEILKNFHFQIIDSGVLLWENLYKVAAYLTTYIFLRQDTKL